MYMYRSLRDPAVIKIYIIIQKIILIKFATATRYSCVHVVHVPVSCIYFIFHVQVFLKISVAIHQNYLNRAALNP